MSDRAFLDTNVLVYTFDSRESVKKARANGLVAEALQGHGIISFQVVQEFLEALMGLQRQERQSHSTATRRSQAAQP